MNILQLCLSSGLGGLELYVFRASASLQHRHHVVPVLLEQSKLERYFMEHSSLARLNIKRSSAPLPIITAKKLANIIDENGIDIIHMHWGKDFALAALAKQFSRRRPKLVYTRQMMITRYKSDWYHRFLYSNLDLLITITRQLEQLYQKYTPLDESRIRTLYYGVDEPDTKLDKQAIAAERINKGFNKDDFIVGLFGRLEDGKGQHLLIKALATAKYHGKNIKALIVGHEMDAGYLEILKKLATDNQVTDNIIFNDFVSNPQQLMQICNCICLTTYEETFGLVLPEAMRAGLAVIGSNNGGVPEIIEHEKSGLLFETKKADSLYQQVSRLYDDTGFMKTLAKQGKEKADNTFNTQTHFSELENLLIATAQQT